MNLQNINLKKISSDELANISGGVVDPITTGIAIGAAVAVIGAAANEIISDWEHFKDGLF